MRIIVGMSGASGAILGIRMLEALQRVEDCETHLVISESAEQTIRLETGYSVEAVKGLADVLHDIRDMGATIASGSFKTDGMIVAPCSMKTLSAVAAGFSYNLLVRAVDVCLKERRKVVLLPREMPFNAIHLRNLQVADQSGCLIMPPMLTFYNHPATIDDMVDHVIGKTLMQFGVDFQPFKAWEGTEAAQQMPPERVEA
ncbi:MAG TPA: UbiX family flavin prenyltransferase [Aggregatilinea sp.]|uniref:UbiX family flavin prenyltransferase n=1 Tax=Aggregatilinea sp. TaxID=2806333 RepID=UPI002CA78C16|nr:UbiX family flavin prenyltransferase [Aggregatilinea sp.]HML23980.1 UbiX family flavin prenyltransferase [Aggregatilinea sp.]